MPYDELNEAAYSGFTNACIASDGYVRHSMNKISVPEELKDIAGAISSVRSRDLRSRITASFLKAFYGLCEDLCSNSAAGEYKKRSFIIGKHINVIRSGQVRPAKALDIDEECRLIVRYEDGSTEALSSGEVSVRT